MPVHVETRGAPRTRIEGRELKRRASRMLAALRLPQAELSVLLCDDATIRALNRDYRKKDRPTDVLAFAMREGAYAELAGDMLGDVIISLETAARQAQEKNVLLDREVTMLLAHGLLHLLGFDHGTRTEERRMTARTDALVSAAIDTRARRLPSTIATDRPKMR